MAKTLDLRAAMLAASVPTVDVDVPAPVSQTVRVSGLTTGGRDALEDAVQGKGKRFFRASLVIATVSDPATGDPLFEPEDVDLVQDLPAFVTEPLVNAAMKCTAVSEKDLEDLEGNSGAAQSGGSGSD